LVESSPIKRFAFVGEMNLILSLDFSSPIYVGFFLLKLAKSGFLAKDLGDRNVL